MKGLLGVTLQYQAGRVKLDEIPQGLRKHVLRLAQFSKEQELTTSSGMQPRRKRQIGVPTRVRRARSF
jgi:hypothetical protein